MAEPHLDHPGDVSWFPGKAPGPVLGPCPHDRCPHDAARCVAWGPDLEHYTLDECTVPAELGGCAGQCRAWSSETPHPRGGVAYGWGEWQQIGGLTSGDETGHPAPARTADVVPVPPGRIPLTRSTGLVPVAMVPGFVQTVAAAANLHRPDDADPISYRAGVEATIGQFAEELVHRGWFLAAPRDPGT